MLKALDKTNVFIKPGDKGSHKRRGSSAALEGLLDKQIIERTPQMNCVDTALNIKGKNLELYREIRRGIGRDVHCGPLKMNQGTRAMMWRPLKQSSQSKSTSGWQIIAVCG
jgi:hypothetical protein